MPKIRLNASGSSIQLWVFVLTMLVVLGLFLWPLISEGFDSREEALSNSPSVIADVPSIPADLVIDGDRLKQSVQVLSVERSTKRQRKKARDYIESKLDEFGWVYEEDRYDTGVNIVARQAVTVRGAREVLVGAHYDSQPGTPGADDNATGVSVTLEIARQIRNHRVPKTLTLVFFDQEEKRGLGSLAYTSNPEHLEQLDGAIILEMLGYTCAEVGCQEVPEKFPVDPPSDVGDFLTVVGDLEHPELTAAFESQRGQTKLPLLAFSVPYKGVLTPVVLSSDHVPFWLQGAGAVMVTDTAYLRNPHYHKDSDDPSSLDWDFLNESGQIVVNAVWGLLNRE